MQEKTSRVKIAFESVMPPYTSIDGQKAPIILIHGAASSRQSWSNIMLPLAQATGRKVYAYDTRDHGDSEWSNELTYEEMEEDLLHLMESWNVKRAILIGHSMGGKTAMFFARHWPSKVEKLVIEDISPKQESSELQVLNRRYIKLLEIVLEKIPSDMKDLAEAKNFVHELLQEKISVSRRSSRHGTTDGSSLPLTQDENGDFRWKTNIKALLETYQHTAIYSSFHPDEKFTGPVLIIYSPKSAYFVENDKDFVLEIFPNTTFIAVEGATHQIHLEFPEVFLKEVTRFITDASSNNKL